MKDSNSGKSMATDPSTKDGPANSTAGGVQPSKGISALVFDLIRPYRKWLVVVFAAMLVETAMSLAAPWPLKIIIDSVIGKHKLPEFLTWLRDFSAGEHTLALAGVAAIGVVIIAIIGAVAGYIDSYYTESVAQYVANDLRERVYHHLQRLSLRYYDTHQDRKSTRLNSSHRTISYAVFCLKKKKGDGYLTFKTVEEDEYGDDGINGN